MFEHPKDTKFKLFIPFGPRMADITLPTEIMDKLIKITDDILDDDNRISHGHSLAGQIQEEPQISWELMAENGLEEYFDGLLKLYAESSLATMGIRWSDLGIEKTSPPWIVSQYENEYNPLHWHTNSTMSCVIYLKVPKFIPRDIPGKRDTDGKIVFVNHTVDQSKDLNLGVHEINPVPGKMYIFPANLNHAVWPFQGEGERRSISFNAKHYHTLKSV